MSLTQHLKNQGFDLIGGPVRNHKLLQVWLKREFDRIDFLSSDVNKIFTSNVALTEIEDPAMSVTYAQKDEYKFNIGITILEDILKSLGLGSFEISAKLQGGKKVTISYDNSITKVVEIGDVSSYFANADFKDANPVLLKDANRENLFVITGMIFAKNLSVDIETTFEIDANLVASLNGAADGKLDFSRTDVRELKMVSSGSNAMPIAVKAHRLVFNKGVFKNLRLVTDTMDLF